MWTTLGAELNSDPVLSSNCLCCQVSTHLSLGTGVTKPDWLQAAGLRLCSGDALGFAEGRASRQSLARDSPLVVSVAPVAVAQDGLATK